MRLGDITGTDDDNIFVVGASGVAGYSAEAYHNNGVDWFHLENLQIPSTYYSDVSIIDGEAFIIGHTLDFPEKAVMLHGE